MRRSTILGLTALAAGLILGFWPLASQGTSCGNAFHATDTAASADMSNALGGNLTHVGTSCDNLRGSLRYPTWILLLAGAAVLVYSVGDRMTSPRRRN